MLSRLLRSMLGLRQQTSLKEYQKVAEQIARLEPTISALDDQALGAKTAEFRERLAKGATLKDLLPEAFAVCREASKRVLGMRHFDVQLIGGMALHDGRIAEMRTGEGKTLVATLAVYLNALEAKGVHVVTVNDYLAHRDAHQMAPLYAFLGLSTGLVLQGMQDGDRKAAYAADVTYATNSEIGFDYLRDNMRLNKEDEVQRPYHFAVVDEVDSILIDEARTPLIISGAVEDASELYRQADAVIAAATQDTATFERDEKARTVHLTELGNGKVEELLQKAGMLDEGGLYDIHNLQTLHVVSQALKARTLFQRDVHYITRNGKVLIVDENTGRVMDGRRYSDGLHQALEAKEQVAIEPETQTLASVTYQNLFRFYPKLSGMTGTAMTEADEFEQTYNLDVFEVPTNRPIARADEADIVFRTSVEKYASVAELVEECRERGQPVLVGTASVEQSELLSGILMDKGIPHQVLNARHHEREAAIIAQAGRKGAVTIATNMAGRGTDIQLGGNVEMLLAERLAELPEERRASAAPALEADIKALVAAERQEVLEAGGLYVIGTERHESRRVDNQLRGRAGRQGDPGRSRFFISLQDDLMRIFGGEKMGAMLGRLGLGEGEALVHPMISRAIEKAQRRVEMQHFDSRKNLQKYDAVAVEQRKEFYAQRKAILATADVTEMVAEMRADMVETLVQRHIPENAYAEQWDMAGLTEQVASLFGLTLPLKDWAGEEGIAEEEIQARLLAAVEAAWAEKQAAFEPGFFSSMQRSVLLQMMDSAWQDHLTHIEQLRQGINLRAYAQRDPLNEFRMDAFTMFGEMLGSIRVRTVSHLMQIQPLPADLVPAGFFGSPRAPAAEMLPVDSAESGPAGQDDIVVPPEMLAQIYNSLPRNSPCICGSGKRFKHCHGGHGPEGLRPLLQTELKAHIARELARTQADDSSRSSATPAEVTEKQLVQA